MRGFKFWFRSFPSNREHHHFVWSCPKSISCDFVLLSAQIDCVAESFSHLMFLPYPFRPEAASRYNMRYLILPETLGSVQNSKHCHHIRGLSGNYPSSLNVSITGRVALGLM